MSRLHRNNDAVRPCGVSVRASRPQLVPGSAAANSPLQCGQVLKSINGIDCSHCSTDDLADLLLGPEGSLVRVQTIGRGGHMQSVNLERGLPNNLEHEGQSTRPHSPECAAAFLQLPPAQGWMTTGGKSSFPVKPLPGQVGASPHHYGLLPVPLGPHAGAVANPPTVHLASASSPLTPVAFGMQNSTGHADCGASGVSTPVLGMQIPRPSAFPFAHFEDSTSLNLAGSGGEGDRFGRLGADGGLFGEASIQKERTRLEQQLQGLGGMEQTMIKASFGRQNLQMPGGRAGVGSFGQGAMPQANGEVREVQI